MNILFVDDMVSRFSRFRLNFPMSAKDQIRYKDRGEEVSVDDFRWADLVMLDHDMCERHYGDYLCPRTKTNACTCETGYDLLKRVIDQLAPNEVPALTVVHSLNPSGSENILNTLMDKDWRFSRLQATYFGDPSILSRLYSRVKGFLSEV